MIKLSHSIAAILTLACLTAASNSSAATLEVGQPIPGVILKNEANEDVDLKELVQDKPAVLIFYRGGWCPYCTRHLEALAGIEGDLNREGYQIIGISPDQPSVIAETPGKEKLTYTLLSDSLLEGANAFGLAFKVDPELVQKYKSDYDIDIEAASGQMHHMLPHPAVFVVGSDGKVQFAYSDENYRERLDPSKILEAVRGN